ncbi:fatty acid hydroxylase [Russula vinacea]|nr:fatty acid hydroxylase [Russula vinacea]
MDLVLSVADEYLLDKAWAFIVPASVFVTSSRVVNISQSSLAPPIALPPTSWHHNLVSHLPHPPFPSTYDPSTLTTVSAWPRDYIPRQLISLSVVTLIGIFCLYLIFAGLSYQYIFNHDMILRAFPGMTLLTLPWFQAEVRGYSKLYDSVDEYGLAYLLFSVPFFLVFTDYGIYWVHRTLHHPSIYKYVHKPHHRWLIPTPFASHAFHPLDGYLQSVPYHLFIFLFPLHRWLYLGLFVFVNFWSILIHDSDMITGHVLESVINGPAHHTLHHLFFTVNYGQYFTWADRWGGSYRQPVPNSIHYLMHLL